MKLLLIITIPLIIISVFLIRNASMVNNRLEIDERRMDKLETRIDEITLTYDQYRILKCESDLDENTIGDKNLEFRAYGIAQFQVRTFNWLAKKFNFKGSINNAEDQIKLFKLAIDNGYGYLWSCSKKI